MLCLNCQNTLSIKQVKFCSRSCAATYNNKHFIKRTKENKCIKCFTAIRSGAKYCGNCYKSINNSLTYTVGEIKDLYKNKTTTALAAKIRGYGRYIYDKSDKAKYCINCGYSKHYEVCHIKPVNSFADDTPMSEVHAINNLIALCPNCHWEFDHGMLSI